MPATIPDAYLDILKKNVFASFVTLMEDGSPQVTPVWIDFDGTHFVVNSALGRMKDRNIRRDPRVALSLSDPENPYRYLEVRGRVVEITQDGADDHVNAMAKKYLGQDVYPFRQPGEERVIYRIAADRISSMG